MTVATALQSAAVRLVGRRPSAFFSSTEQLEIELCDLANEVAIDISKSHDWQALTKIATLTGDGTTVEFSLPTDYDRMLVDADLQDSNTWAWGYQRILSMNEWSDWLRRGYTLLPGGWIIFGNKFHFQPAPETGATTFPYISNARITDQGGTPKNRFDADGDTFMLPERLLTLGVIWRWREQKKLECQGEQDAFVKAFSEYAAKDAGSKVIRENGTRWFPGASRAWPWELG